MRPIPTFLGTVMLGATMALTAAPAAHAENAPTTAQCEKAVADAERAEADYNAALRDYRAVIDAGGHPDKSQQEQVAQAENNRNATASTAARVCPDAKMPSGTMRTGSGSTSESAEGPGAGTGIGLVAAVGAGAFVLARRRSGSKI